VPAKGLRRWFFIRFNHEKTFKI